MAKRKAVTEKFKSLNSLVDTMEERPLRNTAFKNRENLASQTIEKDEREPWSGTKTYFEAMEIMKTGYDEPIKRMKRAILKVGENERKKRPKLKNDFVGFVPHVPNTIMGLPMTMINKDKNTVKKKTINLIYSLGASANISPRDMEKGGVMLISLVNSLEKQGYRVKIDILACFTTDKTIASMLVNVKEHGHKLNLLKLTFPLVQPAMFRRIAFKWLETTPELKDNNFTFAYGKPLTAVLKYNNEREAQYLKEHGIIKTDNTYFFTVYEAMKHETPETLAYSIGITK